ncbi:heavy metal translocating P-type ATPase [Derxia gummosa]|uniref:Heavy metal translocating P-type ATPase n=1 Tax=Derxia gummosa DSM 723 TaxID=1121388 RepID=A0A8B6X5W6_9BURK|nr:heavy metal translocating P-type ATPase [Derxia gummosa]
MTEQAGQRAECFHCGAPVPPRLGLFVNFKGRMEPVCCHGCEAVAQTIIEGGFDAYYARREALALQAEAARPGRDLEAFDDERFQRGFVREPAPGEREAVLTMEGIRCASCVWLGEQAAGRVPGVLSFNINLMTERATLRWDPVRVKLSQILHALDVVGYRAWPFDVDRHEALIKTNQQRMLRQLFVAGMGMMQVMMYVVPFYLHGDDIEPEFVTLIRWVSLLLTTPVVLYSAAPMFAGAWRDLRARRVGMDVPVVLAIIAAFIASTWHTVIDAGEVYFDSITMFVFLLLWGRYLEVGARRKAMQGVDSLLRLAPRRVDRLGAGGTRESVRVEELLTGECIEVAAGQALPVDMALQSERAQLDLSLLTGESHPVTRRPGDVLPAGAVNLGDPITGTVARIEADSTVSVMRRLIDRAASERPRVGRVADRIASWFLAGLLVFTLLVSVVWWFVEPQRALPIAIALLVVSCPCALSLATPASFAAAISALSRRGVLLARADALEALAGVTDVVFDKTGTLTQSTLSAEIEVVGELPERDCWEMVAALEVGSTHPVGRALLRGARERGINERTLSEREVVVGRGVQATVDGAAWRVGNGVFALAFSVADMTDGVWLSRDGVAVARWRLTAPVRAGAAQLVARLRARGLRVWLMSGDGQPATEMVAQAVGIDAAHGSLLPEQKLKRVRKLQSEGGRVAMIGDGINDAPVLSGADVSIAMSEGAEIAQVSSDAVMVSRDLVAIDTAFGAAATAMSVTRQNLWWASIYNALAIPAAAFGLVTPWVASLGMSLSSLLVVLNALRLLRIR